MLYTMCMMGRYFGGEEIGERFRHALGTLRLHLIRLRNATKMHLT